MSKVLAPANPDPKSCPKCGKKDHFVLVEEESITICFYCNSAFLNDLLIKRRHFDIDKKGQLQLNIIAELVHKEIKYGDGIDAGLDAEQFTLEDLWQFEQRAAEAHAKDAIKNAPDIPTGME